MTTVYAIDGRRVQTLEDFWRVIGEAVNGPGGYFGRNLDALHDCLHGGMGAPEDDDYVFEWRYHEVSRRDLGYTETARQLRIRLDHCHPSNRPLVKADLRAAKAGTGPTVFDWLTGLLDEHGKLRLA